MHAAMLENDLRGHEVNSKVVFLLLPKSRKTGYGNNLDSKSGIVLT